MMAQESISFRIPSQFLVPFLDAGLREVGPLKRPSQVAPIAAEGGPDDNLLVPHFDRQFSAGTQVELISHGLRQRDLASSRNPDRKRSHNVA